MNDSVDCSNIHDLLPSLIPNKHTREAYVALQRECFLMDNYEIHLSVARRIIQRELGVTEATAKRHIHDICEVYKLAESAKTPSMIVVKSYPEIVQKNQNDIDLIKDLKKSGCDVRE